MLIRSFVDTLKRRLQEPSPLIQVILGPRQVGKTTGVKQALAAFDNAHYFSADDVLTSGREHLLEWWQTARMSGTNAVLAIDEIQKVSNWSETVKKLWDEESPRRRLKCVLLGSGSLTLQQGLTESLAGRFELIRVPHWSYAETRRGFGLNLDEYLRFGGYPGAYAFVSEIERWQNYVRQSILETVIGKDILSLRTVHKPALFRQAFTLLMQYPAQEISYRKLLGQLQDKGNTDLVKHYIELYEGAFLVKALQKYSAKPVLRKSSSPKILPLCPALHTANEDLQSALTPEKRGRLFELAAGMVLAGLPGALYYWRDGNAEVDYIHVNAGKIFAIEVKSGRKKKAGGLEAFLKMHSAAKAVFITPDSFESFSENPAHFLREA